MGLPEPPLPPGGRGRLWRWHAARADCQPARPAAARVRHPRDAAAAERLPGAPRADGQAAHGDARRLGQVTRDAGCAAAGRDGVCKGKGWCILWAAPSAGGRSTAVHCLIHFAWFPRCVFGECFFVRTSENTVTRGGRGRRRALGTRGRTYIRSRRGARGFIFIFGARTKTRGTETRLNERIHWRLWYAGGTRHRPKPRSGLWS